MEQQIKDPEIRNSCCNGQGHGRNRCDNRNKITRAAAAYAKHKQRGQEWNSE